MKKTFKIIGWIFIAMFIIGFVGRIISQSSYENSIQSQISRLNRECPIPVAGGAGEIKSITLENKFVTYRMTYRTPYMDIDALKRYPSATRDLCYLSFVMVQAQGSQVEKLVDELISNGIGIKVVFSDDAGNSFTSEMTPQYITEMKHDVQRNPSEALHDAIQLKLAMDNINLPIEAGEGMTMTNIELDNDNLVTNCIISEDIYDLDVLQEASDAVAQDFLQNAINDPGMTAFLDLCKVSHTGLTYRIIGDKSKRQIDINIPAEIIQQYRSTPAVLNIH